MTVIPLFTREASCEGDGRETRPERRVVDGEGKYSARGLTARELSFGVGGRMCKEASGGEMESEGLKIKDESSKVKSEGRGMIRWIMRA